MKKLFTVTKSNHRFFHRINFRQFWGLERREFWFLNCGREGMTRNASHFNVDGKMIFRCQGRPLKVSLKLYDKGSRNKILN